VKFIVLRDLQRTRLASPYGPGAQEAVAQQYGWPNVTEPPIPRVDVEDTDAKGRHELIDEPDVVAVAAAMPTHLIEPRDTTRPNAGGDSWGLAAVGATGSGYTGAGTVVAVLDTGIDSEHPAFGGLTILQRDFTGSGNGDRNGHGTHCSGTVFGRDVDNSRIGIAKGVQRVLIGKVLTDTGVGSSEMVFRGLRWAIENGAHVVSMSLGFDFPGMVSERVQQGWPADLATSVALEAYRGNLRMFDALMTIIRAQEPFNSGCVVVAAAGNESRRDLNPDYEIAASLPAAADGVLSTGALGKSLKGYTIAPFSNSFPKLCAPGVDIKSARHGGGLQTMSGTSMACPHVAGVAALWWETVRVIGLPLTATTVIARMVASCSLDGLDPHIDIADRGYGVIAAP
jgi:subtilisin family serine protease